MKKKKLLYKPKGGLMESRGISGNRSLQDIVTLPLRSCFLIDKTKKVRKNILVDLRWKDDVKKCWSVEKPGVTELLSSGCIIQYNKSSRS